MHDSPKRMAEALPCVNNVHEIVQVILLVDKKKKDSLMEKVLALDTFLVRPTVAYKWLQVLSRTHHSYFGIKIDETQTVSLQQIPQQLLASALDSDEIAQKIDVAIQSDVAHVRSTEDDPEIDSFRAASSDFFAISTFVEGAASEAHSFVFRPAEASEASCFNALRKVLKIESKRVAAEPLNEFSENNKVIIDGFPYLFLLGRGLEDNGPLKQNFVEHRMCQFSNQMPNDERLIFTLFNQMQKHAAARSVSLKVRNNENAFREFGEKVCDPAFQDELKQYSENPETPEAKDFLASIMPLLGICSRSIPYGALRNSSATSELYALCGRYGSPSTFLTISPDDLHDSLVIRLSIPSGASTFPRQDNGLNALQCNDLDVVKSLSVPTDCQGLRALIFGNQASAVRIFSRILDAVSRCLLSSPWEQNYRKTTVVCSKGL